MPSFPGSIIIWGLFDVGSPKTRKGEIFLKNNNSSKNHEEEDSKNRIGKGQIDEGTKALLSSQHIKKTS